MKPILLTLLFFASLCATAQRRIDVVMEGFFPFDPVNGYYLKNSLAPVHTYMEDWRRDEPGLRLCVADSLSWGYRHYCTSVDTTLLPRVMEYLGGSVASVGDTTLRVRDLSDFPQSHSFLDYFASDIQAVKRYFATPLRTFDTVLHYSPYEGNDFEALFHTFQVEVGGADFSFFAPPGFDAKIPRELYIKDVAGLLYYDNDLVVVELSGAQLKELMERSYGRRYYTLSWEEDDLLRFRTPAYLHTSLCGVPHTVNLSKRVGRRVENWGLESKRIYRVAMNSFLARDFKVLLNKGDYKELIIRWLKECENPLRERTQSSLQPARIIEKVRSREEDKIFSSEF